MFVRVESNAAVRRQLFAQRLADGATAALGAITTDAGHAVWAAAVISRNPCILPL